MEEQGQLVNDLRAELALREQELALFHELDLRFLTSDRLDADTFSFILLRSIELLQASRLSVLLRRGSALETAYSTIDSALGQRTPIAGSLAGECLQANAVLNLDLTNDQDGGKYALEVKDEGASAASLLLVPIGIRESTIGVLSVESFNAQAFNPIHQRIAVAIAARMAIALQRAQMFDSRALSADLDRMLFATSANEPVIPPALERVLAELRQIEPFRSSVAQILFRRGQHDLEVVHSTNPLRVGQIVPISQSVSGCAIVQRKTIIVSYDSERPDHGDLLGEPIRSQLAMPIFSGENGVVIGVLNVESEEEGMFNGFNRIMLEDFASKVTTLLAFAKLRADVTEALEIRNANDLLVAVGDRASHMVHVINNIAGAMRAQVVDLQEDLQELQREGRLAADDILSESLARLRELIDQMLKTPREALRPLDEDGAKIKVNDAVREAVAEIPIPKNIEVELALVDGIPAVQLYSFDIVVQNLLQNSIDAMPDGGKIAVSTSILPNPDDPAGYFELVVRDTGAGIPADIADKVFELNFTTKPRRNRGLGLGLWWVRVFVRRARGDIAIRSKAGQGTEAIIRIPISGTPESNTIGAERPVISEPSVGARKRILIVDDVKEWRDILSKEVQANAPDCSIQTASDLASAKRLIAMKKFAVIFVDIGLDNSDDRNMDGLEIMAEVRAMGDESSMIVITGRGGSDVLYIAREAIMRYGSYEIVAKTDVQPSHIKMLLNGGLERYAASVDDNRENALMTLCGGVDSIIWTDRVLMATRMSDVRDLHYFLDELLGDCMPLIAAKSGEYSKIDERSGLVYGTYWSRGIGMPILVCFGSPRHLSEAIDTARTGSDLFGEYDVGIPIKEHFHRGIKGAVFPFRKDEQLFAAAFLS